MNPTEWTPPNPKYPPPKANEPPLHRAARTGDDAAIATLAASGGLEAVFDLQLDPGARPTPATPLMVAAGSGDGATASTVGLLLQLGSDPKATAGGRSAADFACSGLGWNYRPGGDAERLRLLLEAGSPLTVTGMAGARLVGEVAKRGDADRLAILLDRGANPQGWYDPAEWAKFEADVWKKVSADRRARLDRQGLPEEIRQFRLKKIESVPDHMKSSQGPPDFLIPLFCAVGADSIACVRLLLDAGADVRQRDGHGRTTLWKARSESMLRLLLERGLALEEKDKDKKTPLTEAVSFLFKSALPRVRALLACGADPNATDGRGFTVFMSAVSQMLSRGCLDVLKALIAAGADPHAVTALGWNAFHAAAAQPCLGPSVQSVLAFIRDLGVDIEARDQHGCTPLALAILKGLGSQVRVLLELGADPNVMTPRQCSEGACSSSAIPLIFHAISAPLDRVEKVEALLKGGIRLDTIGPQGRSPLEFARAHRQEVETGDSEHKQRWLDDLDRCIQIIERARR